MPNDLAKTRITKRLAPDQPGAKKLAQRFGDELVCVRYRQDPAAGHRYTTVEIVVDDGPILNDRRLPPVVYLRIAAGELALQRSVRQEGAEWDRQRRAWRISKEAMLRLQLQHRVVRKYPPVATGNGKN